jgi:hypothetical protein
MKVFELVKKHDLLKTNFLNDWSRLYYSTIEKNKFDKNLEKEFESSLKKYQDFSNKEIKFIEVKQ